MLDRHNLIYAYGRLNDFEIVLQALGVRQGEPVAPDPHMHRYHQAWDGAEGEVVATSTGTSGRFDRPTCSSRVVADGGEQPTECIRT